MLAYIAVDGDVAAVRKSAQVAQLEAASAGIQR